MSAARSKNAPQQAAALGYAEQRKAKSQDRGGSLMGAPRAPSGGEGASNAPASAGDPNRVPGDSFSQTPGASPGRPASQMGDPFAPKDFLPGFSGSPPSRAPSVMGSPVDPDDRTSSLPDSGRDASFVAACVPQRAPSPMGERSGLDAASMGGVSAVSHFLSNRDSRAVGAPMGASARKLPGGQGGNG